METREEIDYWVNTLSYGFVIVYNYLYRTLFAELDETTEHLADCVFAENIGVAENAETFDDFWDACTPSIGKKVGVIHRALRAELVSLLDDRKSDRRIGDKAFVDYLREIEMMVEMALNERWDRRRWPGQEMFSLYIDDGCDPN